VVWHHSLLLMNSFKKSEAAVFSCRLCFLRAFHFISLLIVHAFESILQNAWVFYHNFILLDTKTPILFTKKLLKRSNMFPVIVKFKPYSHTKLIGWLLKNCWCATFKACRPFIDSMQCLCVLSKFVNILLLNHT